MIEEAYDKLANKLDLIPNGFPRTESGVELKLLAKLFTQEEAELASYLGMEPQTIAEIANKSNRAEAETKSLLIGMMKKGLIDLS